MQSFFVAPVIAPRILALVVLQVFLGNGMIDATYAALCERPKTFDGIGVAIPTYIDLLSVVYASVVVSRFTQEVICSPFVRVDRGRWKYSFKNVRLKRNAFCVLHRSDNNLAATLEHPKNWRIVSLTRRAASYASLTSTPTATDIRFINFNRSASIERLKLFGHEFVSDLMSNAPRGLVGYAKLSFQLLRGDSATSACHQVHRIKPKVKRRGRLVEDSSRGRRNVLSACLASPRLALLGVLVALEFALRFALWALRMDTVLGVPITPKEFKASVVIGKLFHEFHERVLRLRRLGPFRLFSVYWWHSEAMLPYSIYSVKG